MWHIVVKLFCLRNMSGKALQDDIEMIYMITVYKNITMNIKTHSSVSAAKKQKKTCSTQVCYLLGTVKLPNWAFCISKTTTTISTKFTYFLPYIYTTSQIKIEGNHFSISWDICSWKLPNFLHILLLRTKLQIYLSYVKITFSCCNFFQIWNTNNTDWGLHFPKILKISKTNWGIYVL